MFEAHYCGKSPMASHNQSWIHCNTLQQVLSSWVAAISGFPMKRSKISRNFLMEISWYIPMNLLYLAGVESTISPWSHRKKWSQQAMMNGQWWPGKDGTDHQCPVRSAAACWRQFQTCWKIQKRITGWWFEPLWKILVNWDVYSQYMGK